MSWRQFVTARCRIFLDEKGADHIVGDIRSAIEQLPDYWDINENRFDQADGFIDISIKAQGETHRSPASVIGEAMEPLNGLEGKSGGAVIYESDFGIDGYDLYGAAEAKDVELSRTRDFEWCSEDFLMLCVTMTAKDWRRVLDNKDEPLWDSIEAADVDPLREKLMPRFFARIEEESDEIAFQFSDSEPYMPEEDYDDNEKITAMYELVGHELSGAAFALLLDALMQDKDGLEQENCSILLCFTNAECENGIYKNTMVDINNIAFLEFTSSENVVSNIRVFAIDGVGAAGSGSV